jgi:transposase InsO family protein
MIQKELQRRLFTVNAKRVRRLMREENLVIQARRFVATWEYSPDHRDWPNLLKQQEITGLNQAWAADITYIDLGHEFVYLAVIIDVCSRAVRGWYLDRDLSSELTHRALDRALRAHGPPKIHHSDHGVQYLSKGYVEKLESHGIAVSCSAKGKPMQNGKCERFMRTLKTGRSVFDGVRELGRRSSSDQEVFGGSVHAKTNSLVVGVCHSCGI